MAADGIRMGASPGTQVIGWRLLRGVGLLYGICLCFGAVALLTVPDVVLSHQSQRGPRSLEHLEVGGLLCCGLLLIPPAEVFTFWPWLFAALLVGALATALVPSILGADGDSMVRFGMRSAAAVVAMALFVRERRREKLRARCSLDAGPALRRE